MLIGLSENEPIKMLQVRNIAHVNCVNSPKNNRYGHTMTRVGDKIYIFGGLVMDGKIIQDNSKSGTSKLMYNLVHTNDLLSFNCKDMKWEVSDGIKTQGTAPIARHFHSTVEYNQNIYIFGGKSNGYFDDVQKYNVSTNTWSKLSISGKAPSPRWGHSAVVFKDSMFIFGGYDQDGMSCADLYQFDLLKHEWCLLDVVGPLPRYQHSCQLYGNQMIIFGGVNEGLKYLNDLWIFDCEKLKWSQCKVKGNEPDKKYGSVMWVHNDVLFVFGGTVKDHDFQIVSYCDLQHESKTWKRLKSTDFPIDDVSGTVYSTVVLNDNNLLFYGGVFKPKSIELIDLKQSLMGSTPFEPKQVTMLSDDVIRVIYRFLSPNDLVALVNTSKQGKFAQMAKENWIWRNKYIGIMGTSDKEMEIFEKSDSTACFKAIIKFYQEEPQNIKDYHPYNVNHKYIGSKIFTKVFNMNIKIAATAIHYPGYEKVKIDSVKCVFIGDGAVGKTCLCISMAHNQYPEDYVPTVFDNYSKSYQYGDTFWGLRMTNLDYWDTAGPEDYDRLRPLSYPNTAVFAVCYNIASRSSFENIKNKWVPEARLHCPETPLVLIATKCDLRTNKDVIDILNHQGKTFVSSMEGLKLAKELGFVAYIETSSLKKTGLKDLIETLLVAGGFDGFVEKPKSKKDCMLQ